MCKLNIFLLPGFGSKKRITTFSSAIKYQTALEEAVMYLKMYLKRWFFFSCPLNLLVNKTFNLHIIFT